MQLEYLNCHCHGLSRSLAPSLSDWM